MIEKQQAPPPQITNAELVSDGKKEVMTPLPMTEVTTRILSASGGQPYRVGGTLFVDCGDFGINWIENQGSLFAWLAGQHGIIPWHLTVGAVTKGEVFERLRMVAKPFEAVEQVPHVPPLPDHYYACPTPVAGDGTALSELLDRFHPSSDIDRDLILAMMATMLWGGPCGSRPAFLITGPAGRGVGKSTLANMVSLLFGGTIDVKAGEDIAVLKQRLLSNEGRCRRVALLDNVKSMKFSWGEFEGLITAPEITGKQMYVGESRRPNTLTWLITLNGASLSTDMAQRCVIITLAEPRRQGQWEEETRAFILANKARILGDLRAFLESPAEPLPRYTRWATWEREILARLPEPNDAQRTILERQGEADVEGEEASILESYFEEKLSDLHYSTDTEVIHIPAVVAAQMYSEATGEKVKTAAVSRSVKQLHDERRLKHLRPNPSRSHGRGLLWVGADADVGEEVRYDLQTRLSTLLGR